MNTPKISVIVPVYKAEKFLRKCIDSILAQTFTDFELLLIDDGSPDNSGKFCDEYAEKDSRIRVFHKENGGVSSARNVGLDNARGEWIAFVDADDWSEKDMLYEMCVHAIKNNVNVVVAPFYVNECHKQRIDYQQKEYLPQNFLKAILEGKAMGSLWNKLIHRNLYDNIRFDTNITYCEDVLALSQILYKADVRISFVNKPYYHYVQVETSITHKINRNTFDMIFAFISKLELILHKNKYSDMGILNVKRISTLIRMVKSQLYSYKELVSVYKSIIQNTDSIGKYSSAYKKLCFKFWLILYPYRSYRLIYILKYIKKLLK